MSINKDSRILVVCHGNVNRSPLAAAVMRQAGLTCVKEAALKLNGGGERAAKKIRQAAKNYGLSLEWNRSTAITYSLFEESEVIVYMDGGNLKRLRALSAEPLPHQRWVGLGEYCNPPVARIPDPAYMKEYSQEFILVVPQIVFAARAFAKNVLDGEFK
jgi:protein-tyrosine-phosphatase